MAERTRERSHTPSRWPRFTRISRDPAVPMLIRGLSVVIEILSPISRRVNQSTVQMVLTRLISCPWPPPTGLSGFPTADRSQLFKVSINLIETTGALLSFGLITGGSPMSFIAARSRASCATRFHFSRLTFNYRG